VDEQLARDLVTGLVQKAATMSPPNFVRVDMEGSPYTQRTLDFVHALHRMPGHGNNVGTVIQSYMLRAEADVDKLLSERIRIRLCKGAYKEPPEVAYQKSRSRRQLHQADEDVTEKRRVSWSGDARREHHQRSQAFAIREKIPRDSFEFQMLHGIRRDLQQSLVRDGWGMRVYVPFGTEWYPTFMRRLAERPRTCSSLRRIY